MLKKKRPNGLAVAAEYAHEVLRVSPKGPFPVAFADSLLRIGEQLELHTPSTRMDLHDLGATLSEVAGVLAAKRGPEAGDETLGKAVRAALRAVADGPTEKNTRRTCKTLLGWLRGARPELGLTDRRVLVIDDEPSAQKAIGAALRAAGFHTIPCLRARTALSRLRAVKPSLIVLDVEMPDMRGTSLIRAIRRDSRLASVPVIFVSAKKSLDVKLQALRSGADDYVTKPFRPEELATRVASRLDRGAVLQEIALKDPLTGVASHRFFQEKLEEELARHSRYGTQFCIAFIDVDDLSALNAKHGYDAGDRAVVRVAQMLRRGMRRADVIARLAGGEFGVILPETPIEGARTILDRLRQKIARGTKGSPGVGLSGGIAGCPATTSDRRTLLSMAREALELAKRRGKGRLLTADEVASGARSVVVAEPAAPEAGGVLEGLSTAEVRTLREVFVRDYSEHLRRLDALDPSTTLRDEIRAVGKAGHFLAGAGAIGGHPELSELGEAIESAADRLLETGAPPAGTQLVLAEIRDRLQKIGAGLRAGTFVSSDAKTLEQRLRVSLGRAARALHGDEGDRADVLIVDDEKVSQAAIGASLRRAGYSIREAYTGAEALDAVAAKVPDIIILDVMLPDMDGHEVLTRIRGNPKLQLVPVIYVTAKRLLDDKIVALRTGADDYVTKPFSPEELVARVGSKLERARLTRDLALRDGLTGLYNHRFFQERLDNELERLERTDKPFCLALLDIDNFKSVNDRHGHQTGDEVLRALASRVASTVRASDIVARYGGEEFALILPETDISSGYEILERIRQIVSETVVVRPPKGGDLVRVTFSAGIAQAGGESKERLFERVDEALYASKRSGKDRVTVAQAPPAEQKPA